MKVARRKGGFLGPVIKGISKLFGGRRRRRQRGMPKEIAVMLKQRRGRGTGKERKGGWIAPLLGAVLPSLIAPLAQRIFAKKGETAEGRRRRTRGGMMAAPYGGRRRRCHGGAVMTPGPLA
jgi:hypothetical protein